MRRERFEYDTTRREGIPAPWGIVSASRYAPDLILIEKPSGDWAITHEQSGLIIGVEMPKREARYCAGVLAGLPLDWTLTQDAFVTAFYKQPDVVKLITKAVRYR